MANQLKMAVVQAILTLQGLGWSQRRIAQELGIDRETVARYVHAPPADSKPATNPIPGSEPVPDAIVGVKPASNPISGSGAIQPPGPDHNPGPESLCEPFRAVIQEKLGQGLTGQRIHQDLVEGHLFANHLRCSLQRDRLRVRSIGLKIRVSLVQDVESKRTNNTVRSNTGYYT